MRSLPGRGLVLAITVVALCAGTTTWAAEPRRDEDLRRQSHEALLRATRYLVGEVSTRGGYLWRYLPDLSRRFGEMEAYDTQIAVQPPGTPTMGQVFLEAYRATGDETFYEAAAKAARALVAGQLESGGWHYFIDFGGEPSLRRWHDTIGRNGWRLEEHHTYRTNATFDDNVTADATRFLLRIYLEKRDPAFKGPLDKALALVLESQYRNGGWPQRYPPEPRASVDSPGSASLDYTSFVTFNDDVIWENIRLLVDVYLTLGDRRVLEPIRRGMDVFLLAQGPAPQAGWAEQYTLDLEPAGARTYEPVALALRMTERHVRLLLLFYRLTGERKYLTRIPEALDWFEGCRLPEALADGGRFTHPTLVELGTGRPLFVHREGSNVVNGRYFVDYDPRAPIAHAAGGGRRRADISPLRRAHAETAALTPEEATKDSPLVLGPDPSRASWNPGGWDGQTGSVLRPGDAAVRQVIAALDDRGRWLTRHEWTTHPYVGDGRPGPPTDAFATTFVGDETDTSPFRDPSDQQYLSMAVYARNMRVLIRAIETTASASSPAATAPLVWRLDSFESIGGHPVTVWGAPALVETELGPALQFDGKKDAVLVPKNPLEGLSRFTLEVLFKPAGGGLAEERFVHIQEQGTERRVMVETRVTPDGQFALDTYVLGGEKPGHALLDRAKLHPVERWHWAALVFDGRVLRHYIDGVEEVVARDVTFTPLTGGQTCFGARQNKVSWYKGLIRELRVHPQALAAQDLKRPAQQSGAGN